MGRASAVGGGEECGKGKGAAWLFAPSPGATDHHGCLRPENACAWSLHGCLLGDEEGIPVRLREGWRTGKKLFEPHVWITNWGKSTT